MKKLRAFIILMLFFALVYVQTEAHEQSEIHKSIYKNIVLKNANNAVKAINSLEKSVKSKNQKKAKQGFSQLVQTWKSVEAFYFLGQLSDDYLDTPRYIDTYHYGNEDIQKQLDLILNGKDDVKMLLYKNSHKSINALEYLLFKKNIKDNRVNAATMIIVEAIKGHLQDILSGYKKHENAFYTDRKKANAMMINALITTTYKLHEWRVADVAGLSRKYKNKPDIRRSEYYLSKNSVLAVKSILFTLKEVMDSAAFKDFGDYFKAIGKDSEAKKAIDAINQSLAMAKKIRNDDLTKAKALYTKLKNVHKAFYVHLVDALRMNPKILDADGD